MTPLDSAKLIHSASESSESTGQMSLFGETCESSEPLTLSALWPTPVGNDDNKSIEAYTRMKKGMAGADRKTVTSLNVAVKAGLSPSSPPAIPASHSQSPGSDWARKMTATYGQKLGDWYLNSDPPDSWVRTLLGTSIWGSMTCWLTWKKSATPQGRLLFRLVPSVPRTDEIGSGLSLPTPRVEGFDAGKHRGKPDSLHSYAKMWPTPRLSESELRTYKQTPSQQGQEGKHHGKYLAVEAGQTQSMKLNSAWVSRMMGYPDGWMDVGEETR
jgi:hypothetical protein